MFGTFQAEDEEPVYGLTKPLNSWNPVWANLHVWTDMWQDAMHAPAWTDKLRVWFAPQGWRPAGLPPRRGPFVGVGMSLFPSLVKPTSRCSARR